MDLVQPTDEQFTSQSKAYGYAGEPVGFLKLPYELRLAVYEELLDGATIAISRIDERSPVKSHAAWSLALTCKKIRSELVEVIIKMEKFRFVYPLRYSIVRNSHGSYLDFVLAFLRDATPDHQNKVLSTLNIRIGYKLMRTDCTALMLYPKLGREMSLLHQNLSEICLELPACLLLRPTDDMVSITRRIPYVHPFTIWGSYWAPGVFPENDSFVNWSGGGERGINLYLLADRKTGLLITILHCHNELDFYEKQARCIHMYDAKESVASLNLFSPKGSLWKYQPQSRSLEVGFVECGRSKVMWVSRSFLNIKLLRSASDCTRADLDLPGPGMSTRERKLTDVNTMTWLESGSAGDRTKHLAEMNILFPQCQKIDEPYYPGAYKKDGICVVSQIGPDDGNFA
ncbi:MAG: hypothetical protein Q9165_003409 [Trypethelium subeluteriae]